MLNGKAHIIHRNIPQIASACSKAYKNILNSVVKISIFLFLKDVRFFLKKTSSTIGGRIIVDPINRISSNPLSTLKLIIPVLRYGNMFSKIFVNINAIPKKNIVSATCFQKVIPLFKNSNHFLKEKSFLK